MLLRNTTIRNSNGVYFRANSDILFIRARTVRARRDAQNRILEAVAHKYLVKHLAKVPVQERLGGEDTTHEIIVEKFRNVKTLTILDPILHDEFVHVGE